jgi:hypothetical protein
MATGAHANLCNHVLKRDRGVCALCGRDTIALRQQLDQMPLDEVNQMLINLGYKGRYLKMRMRLWCADHIVPCYLGGEDVLANYRTLCYPCHVGITVPQTSEWATKNGPWGPRLPT